MLITVLKNLQLTPSTDEATKKMALFVGDLNINGKIFTPADYHIEGYSRISPIFLREIIQSVIGLKETLFHYELPPLIDKFIDIYYKEKCKNKESNSQLLNELIDFIFHLQYAKENGAVIFT